MKNDEYAPPAEAVNRMLPGRGAPSPAAREAVRREILEWRAKQKRRVPLDVIGAAARVVELDD